MAGPPSNDVWVAVAKSLAVGRSVRMQCCASDNSALVSHNPKGYKYFCFRCGHDPFVPHGERSIADIMRHRAEQTAFIAAPLALPSDYTLELPDPAIVWLAKASVSPPLARHYKIGWSEKLNRVIMPVFDKAGKLQYMQGRSLDPTIKPKYLNKGGTAVRSVVFWSDPAMLLPSSEPDNGLCVLVEDKLSAIRVGRVQHAASILGTTLTDERCAALMARFKRFVLWLDGDKAGIKGRREAYRKLVLQGAEVHQRVTNKDPKLHTNKQIKEITRTPND